MYSKGFYKRNVPFMDVMIIIGHYHENFREQSELVPKQTYAEVLSIFQKLADENTKDSVMERLFFPENFISMTSLTERLLSEIAKIEINVDIQPNSDILRIK
jgi:hypothetical protein